MNYKKLPWLWLGLAAITWSWIFLIDVARLSSSAVVGYTVIVFAYLVLVGLTALVVVQAKRFLKPVLSKPSWANILKILLVWAVAEFLIAWLVSVVWMGRNGNWDNVLSFYSLTPLLMMTPLKFLTRLLGYFGTSAVIGTGLVIIFRKKFRKFAPVYWSVVLAANLGLWAIYRNPSGPSSTVTVVSEKLGEPQTIDASGSDFVLLPEYGLDNYDSGNVTERFKADNQNVYFSGTKQVASTNGTRNVLVYGSSEQGFMHEQAKSRLITGGEYLPITLEIVLRGINSPVYDDFMVRRAVVRGNQPLSVFQAGDNLLVGNGACSSIINTEDYRKLTVGGATLLANSASLEIFRGSSLFDIYHSGFAKFMATANARPFAQSANNWKAFALDHNGHTLATVRPTGTKDVVLQTNSRKTPYTYLGEWVAILGGLYLIKELIAYKLRKKP